ncbi:AzlC family ABC transporter permease [Lacisediminimonas sp.]|uniref:AzlC family ABC transporter permease n=1 Tax=Lacisediminimonas sp. TaxID=3060582 RepID=UPI00272153C7|nr:AzlC family ABC transporter permease [Lacisediminimonas sp.]MDO8300052.1 AzlC family ABC transporter permease [Lacisediminimonas sp.]
MTRQQEATANPPSAADIEKAAYKAGRKAGAPTLPGIFAWALVTSMAMVSTGLTAWQALGMTFIVFAGSAQLAALPLIAAAAPVWLIFVTAMIVNVRFIIFAASAGPHFAHVPWYRRLLYGYLNGDVPMAYFTQRFPYSTLADTTGKVAFYTGVGYQNWIVWQIGAVIGIFMAGLIPASWNIGFAGTLALLGLLIPLVADRPGVAGVAVSSLIAVALHALPYRLGLLVAVIGGVAAAMALEAWQRRILEREKQA